MGEMTADILVKFPKDENGRELIRPFTIYLMLPADDGFIYAAKKKLFDEEFKARKLKSLLWDWNVWEDVNADELAYLKTIKGKTEPI